MHTPARRIVVADDDPDVARFLELVLERDGYSVLVATDGEEARDLVSSTLPDLVILDVRMPKLDGLAVLQALRSAPSTRDIPVVILSADRDDAAVGEGWQVGATYYLTKPFDIAEVRRYVDFLLPA